MAPTTKHLESIAKAAAEILAFLPTGRYVGIPVANLRHALGAASHAPDGSYRPARLKPPADAVVPDNAWHDINPRG